MWCKEDDQLYWHIYVFRTQRVKKIKKGEKTVLFKQSNDMYNSRSRECTKTVILLGNAGYELIIINWTYGLGYIYIYI